MADDVVSYLETHHPSGWERYFLAEFYRQADDGGDSVSNYGISITRLQCKTRMITTRTSFSHFAMSFGDRQRMRSRIEWQTIPVRCSANTVLDVGTLCMEKVIKLEARYGD